MGCHALLQGPFLTQGSNPHLLRCRQILYPLSHLGSPETFLGDPKPKGKLFWLDLHGLAIDKLGRLHNVKWRVEMFSTSSSTKVRHIQFKREVYNFNHSVLQAISFVMEGQENGFSVSFSWRSLKDLSAWCTVEVHLRVCVGCVCVWVRVGGCCAQMAVSLLH